MSFASDTKRELAQLPIEKGCCARAELAGIIGSGGMVTLKGAGGVHLSVETEHPSVARRVFSLIKLITEHPPSMRTLLYRRLGRHSAYRVELDSTQTRLVLEACALDPFGIDKKIDRTLIGKECCRRAFLRGAFLSSGALGDPGKGYHMEWRAAREHFAQALCRLIRRYAPAAGVSTRRDSYLVYLKDSEQISDMLGALGAVEALLELENIRVVKGMRNMVNRIVNCESANVDKTTNAAQKQIAAIRYLEEKGRLSGLPTELIETAELRLSNPEATLEELGDMFLRPVGKSGVNHRLRKLTGMAKELQDKEEIAW